jgi:hypothetical protein
MFKDAGDLRAVQLLLSQASAPYRSKGGAVAEFDGHTGCLCLS